MNMIQEFFPFLLKGTWVTVKLSLSSLAVGLLLGMLGALAKISTHTMARFLSIGITSVIRGVPELLILFLIYFGGTIVLTQSFGHYVEVSAFTAGVVALALIFAAYASETLRGAYLAIPAGQLEAAKAYGFSGFAAFRYIILPQLWRHALPGLGNLWFVLLKDSALVSLIGLTDLMRVVQNATAYTKKPFNFYLIAALIYLFLTSLSMIGQKMLNQRVNHFIHKEG